MKRGVRSNGAFTLAGTLSQIVTVFTREVCNFLKLFLNVSKKTFHISHVHISQKVKGFLM